MISHFLFLSRRTFGPLMLHEATCQYPEAGRSERAVTARLQAGAMPVTLKRQASAPRRRMITTPGRSPAAPAASACATGRFAEREVGGDWQEAPDALPNEKARPLVLARQLDKVAAITRGRSDEPRHA